MDLMSGKGEVPGQAVLPGMAEELGYEAIKLSPAIEKFCWEYILNGGNGTRAYVKANPKSSPRSARSRAAKLLAMDSIKARLKQIKEELRRKYRVDADDIIEYHSKVLKMDRREYLDEDGKPKKVEDIESEAASILELDIEKGQKSRVVALLKIPPRHQSAVELARIFGLHKERVEMTGKDGRPVMQNDNLSDIERFTRLRAIFDTARERRDGQDSTRGDSQEGPAAEPQSEEF